MTRDEALKVLGLDNAKCALTEAIITRAYRQALVKHHPDTRIALDDAPVVTVDQIKAAADKLRQDVTGADFACKQCNGLGTVAAVMGRRRCGACKGTGDRK